jgi:hypothetical protein
VDRLLPKTMVVKKFDLLSNLKLSGSAAIGLASSSEMPIHLEARTANHISGRF